MRAPLVAALPGIVLALSVALPARAATAATDPAGIARAIYGQISAGDGDSGGQFLWTDRAARPKTISKALVALWAKADAKAATVAVTIVDPRGRRKVAADETVRLDFVREGARWAIDDVRGSVDGGAWSMRKSLESYLAP